MRVANMKGLISANGKHEKAVVTLYFDNSNKAQSPPLYKDDDTISITREQFSDKSVYLINGKKVTNEKVKQLFLSVHLNINNPHFLIKQGEIVKMMKMKPKELLSKIEEVAGTALYETWWVETLETIKKKELKLQEIDMIIKNDINPNLEWITEQR